MRLKQNLRQRLKSNHCQRLRACGQFPATPDQSLVAKMNAIEISDGHNGTAAPCCVSLTWPVADDLHVQPHFAVDKTELRICRCKKRGLYPTFLQVMLAQTGAEQYCKVNQAAASE